MKVSKITRALNSPKKIQTRTNWNQHPLRLNNIFNNNGFRGTTNITLNPTRSWNQTANISTKIKDAGVVIIPVDKKGYSYKMETSLSTRIPTEDKTARVYFKQPPAGHIEDKQAAANLGINHVYIHQDYYRNGAIPSIYMVAFDPHKSTNSERSLKGYMEMLKVHFFVYNPHGSASDVHIDRESLEHILPDNDQIEYGAFLLDAKSKPDQSSRGGQLSLFFKTPGGIWCISCHTSYSALMSNLESYVTPIFRNLRLDLLATPTTTPKDPLHPGMVAGSSLLQQLSSKSSTSRVLEQPTNGSYRDALSFSTGGQSSTVAPSNDSTTTSATNSSASSDGVKSSSTTNPASNSTNSAKVLTDEE